MIQISKNYISYILCGILIFSCLLACIYFFNFGAYGFHPTDYGLILANSWRIFDGGQVPYRDFTYLRTPFSIYLHTLWFLFPEEWIYKASRFGYYLQMALSGALLLLWAYKSKTFERSIRPLVLYTAFLAIALHNFPPMVWYTVDGIFFGSLGLTSWLFSISVLSRKSSLYWRILASIFFVLAGLAKQPFAILTGLFAGYAILELVFCLLSKIKPSQGFRFFAYKRFCASFLPGLMICLLYGTYLWSQGAFLSFWHQVTGRIKFNDFLITGFKNYLDFPKNWVFFAGIATAILSRVVLRMEKSRFYMGRILNICLASLCLWPFVNLQSNQLWALGRLVFLFTLGLFLGKILYKKRVLHKERAISKGILFIGLLCIAWCTGISWGYQTPILGLALVALLFHDSIPKDRKFLFDCVPYILLSIFVVAKLWVINENHPYRDLPQKELVANLGEIYPRFGKLYTNQYTYLRFKELKRLINIHAIKKNLPFTVLTDYPLIHFLSNKQSPFRLDWYSHPEIKGHEKELSLDLLQPDSVIFVHRDRFTLYKKPEIQYNCRQFNNPNYSPIVRLVCHGRKLIAKGKFFCVFQ